MSETKRKSLTEILGWCPVNEAFAVAEWIDEETASLTAQLEEVRKERDVAIGRATILMQAYNNYVSVLSEETFLLRKKVRDFYEQTGVWDHLVKKQEQARKILSEVLVNNLNT